MTGPVADLRLAATVRAIEALDPVDDREARSHEEVLRGLHELDRPFDEDAGPTHVTGSALVVGPRGVVLLRHRRLGIWLQPGGHLDPREWPHDGALREAEEETGLSLAHPAEGPLLLHVDAHDGGRGHRHLDLRYVLHGGEADPAPPPEESQACRWFGWDEAAEVADPGLAGCLDRARAVTPG